MENRHWTEIVEENLVDAFLAFIFLLPFICAGIVATYFIEIVWVKDIVMGLSCVGGIITLFTRVIKIEGK